MTIHLPAETALALAVAMTDSRYGLVLKRYAAEQAIEDLINFLDDTEGDPDLEAAGDERDCSWPEGCRLFGALCEDDEDGGDDEESDPLEPTLGRPDHLFAQDQSLNGWTSHDDCEATNEDGGDVQDEPHDALDEGNDEISLGWSQDMDQRRARAQACVYGDEERWGVA